MLLFLVLAGNEIYIDALTQVTHSYVLLTYTNEWTGLYYNCILCNLNSWYKETQKYRVQNVFPL